MGLVSVCVFVILAQAVWLVYVAAHSVMTEPQNTAPMSCRMGGEPQFGVDHCPGPCDMRAIEGHYANYDSASNPAAHYRRGQRVTIKYQRNNHGPGGFIRMTLVPTKDMMNATKHAENAFHYTCWGARSAEASEDELVSDRFGFSFIGSDGEQHEYKKGYYKIDVDIPEVVPDGDYILGMTWYGGVGGAVTTPTGEETREAPSSWGYFSDYYSCSFVRVSGGTELKNEYSPVFHNDMKKFSQDGCMSANDAPGVCTWEPCQATATYQKPKPFKNGNTPSPLTPFHFGATSMPTPYPTMSPSPTPSSMLISTPDPGLHNNPGGNHDDNDKKQAYRDMEFSMLRACRCLRSGTMCSRYVASKAAGGCRPWRIPTHQTSPCKQACCNYCATHPDKPVCRSPNVEGVCAA